MNNDDVVIPQFPVYCEHGRQIGWALRNERTIISTRFCAPCAECEQRKEE